MKQGELTDTEILRLLNTLKTDEFKPIPQSVFERIEVIKRKAERARSIM